MQDSIGTVTWIQLCITLATQFQQTYPDISNSMNNCTGFAHLTAPFDTVQSRHHEVAPLSNHACEQGRL